ncbi:MAG: hypothetical protein NVS1B2_02860 [Vulcanimicrobiaceae bacterium]
MKFQVRIPRFVSSTVSATAGKQAPILDGRDVTIPNRWSLPPHTVAIVGRPAVWSIIEIETPRIALGRVAIPPLRKKFEQDFGGHLFLIVISGDTRRAVVVEAGPMRSNGTGALVPYSYPEDDFVTEHAVDFDPLVIDPPHGFSREFFADLVLRTHRAYDGNQRYLAIEIPFLRIGRDSNSYVVGILAACGVDARALPELRSTLRTEWTGYPGMEDPVHRSNFGTYFGAQNALAQGIDEAAFYDDTGEVRYAVVGGEPFGEATLPDGTTVGLDRFGRKLFEPQEARARGLPTKHTHPPEAIASRVRFPEHPAPAGAEITFVLDGTSIALSPGTTYTGRVIARNDAIGTATLETRDGSRLELPLAELGLELRDPKRVDRLLREGRVVTVGLRFDRHPRLVSRDGRSFGEAIGVRRFHAPRPFDMLRAVAAATLGLGIAFGIYQRVARS